MAAQRARIGIVGYGYIGSYVYQQITTRPELGLEVAFVHDTDAERVAELPAEVVLDDLGEFADRGADLVAELAHPAVTQEYGAAILGEVDYMPLSMTAFADAALEQALLARAEKNGTCIFIPHGSVVGLEALREGADVWDEVSMVMKKPPRNLDFARHPTLTAEQITEETVVYDGPTRDVCPLFPRNVNSHATLAMGTIGLDRTRSVLIADPALDVSVLEIEARGEGVELKIVRSNPMKGVTGVFTLASVQSSISRAKGPGGSLQVC